MSRSLTDHLQDEPPVNEAHPNKNLCLKCCINNISVFVCLRVYVALTPVSIIHFLRLLRLHRTHLRSAVRVFLLDFSLLLTMYSRIPSSSPNNLHPLFVWHVPMSLTVSSLFVLSTYRNRLDLLALVFPTFF